MLCGLFTVGASAVDYNFAGVDNTGFYSSTNYQDEYGSRYNYGGNNVIDFELPPLPGLPENSPITSEADVWESDYYTDSSPTNYFPETWQLPMAATPAFTDSSAMLQSNGSVGIISIPSLGISMNAYPGATTTSMAKGLGHFSDMSGWDGNVGFCGHNRGANYTIGSVKDLSIGDTIEYTTIHGTRTYSVSFVGNIAANDWSYLGQTADNRITLITCLADQPSLRVCVQGQEIK